MKALNFLGDRYQRDLLGRLATVHLPALHQGKAFKLIANIWLVGALVDFATSDHFVVYISPIKLLLFGFYGNPILCHNLLVKQVLLWAHFSCRTRLK